MKRISQYILAAFAALLLITSSCQKDEYDMGALVAPTNVNIAVDILGADDENPYGDGSGLVNFKATAQSVITFYIDFGDGKDREVVPSGDTTHFFAVSGVNTYNVTVYAVGTGGITTTKTVQVEVLSEFDDPDATQYLTGGTTKTWYWAADQPGHLGLGPNNFDYEPGSWTFPQWYQAAPWEKTESTLYLCELKFSIESGALTFEQINPSGEAFIQGVYAAELGLGDEGSYPFDIAGVKNVFYSPSSSIATVDGGYRGTTMSFTNGGFMGFYAGSSTYEIMEVTDNLLTVRMVQANEPLFAWYHIFTNVKPEQK
jgi:hypothetical protein